MRTTTGTRTPRSTPWLSGVRRLLALALVAALSSGCLLAGERVCVEGEQPVLFLQDGRLQGGACFAPGAELPPGFVRYPADLEPTLLSDQPEAQAEFQRRLDDGRGEGTGDGQG